MTKQLSIGTLLSVLIVGEIMTISAGILRHMNTEKIALLIVAFAGIWMIVILASVWVDRTVNGW